MFQSEKSAYKSKVRLIAAAILLIVSGASSADTLVGVIRHTINTNPRIFAAIANEGASYHAAREAEGEFLPQISASVTVAREQTTSPAQRLATDQANIILERSESRITANQLLFHGGRVYKTVQARRYDYKASRFRTHGVRETIIFETTESYLDVLKFRRLVTTAAKNIKVHEETLRKASAKFKAGAGRRVDVELGISRLAKARAQYDAFVGDLQEAAARYSTITALIPSTDMEMPSLPDKFLPPSLAAGIKMALERNPILQVSNAEFLANDARVGVAKSAFWPAINAEATATDNENLDGIEGPNRDALISLIIRYDIYRGGSDLANYRLTTEERRRSLREVQQARRLVIQEVRVAWAQMTSTQAEIEKLLVHVEASGKVVRDYKIQFNIGVRPLFNVLDAENDYFNARVALINTQFNNAAAYYRVLQATGRITSVLLGGIRC